MNAAKKGLGRGLSALFGDVEVKSSSIDLNTNSLPIADLERNKYQPRSIFDNEKFPQSQRGQTHTKSHHCHHH